MLKRQVTVYFTPEELKAFKDAINEEEMVMPAISETGVLKALAKMWQADKTLREKVRVYLASFKKAGRAVKRGQ
jgi:cytochrome c556